METFSRVCFFLHVFDSFPLLSHGDVTEKITTGKTDEDKFDSDII